MIKGEDSQELDVRPDNGNTEAKISERENLCRASDVEHTEACPGYEPDDYASCSGMYHPQEVETYVQSFIALSIGVQFRNSEQGLRTEILLEDPGDYHAQAGEERIQHCQGPALVQRASGVPAIALIQCLGQVEEHLLPERQQYEARGAHVVPSTMNEEQALEEAELGDAVVGSPICL